MPNSSNLCEICGAKEAVFLVLLEGAKLMACPYCSKGAKILHSFEQSEGETRVFSQAEKKVPTAFREEETIVEGYGNLIRAAREKKGIKREEIAKAINERESYLEHIEKERTSPPILVVRKLEKYLGIKLTEKSTPDIVAGGSGAKQDARRPFTLADALEETKKDKKKK